MPLSRLPIQLLVRRLGLLCAGVLLAGGARAESQVERISFAARADDGGYVLRVHTTAPVQAYWEPRRVAAHQLEWTLVGAHLASGYQAAEPEGPVQDYDVQENDGALHVRLHLDPARPVEVAAYRDGRSPDLLLTLTYREAAAPPLRAVAAADAPQSQAENEGLPAEEAGPARRPGTDEPANARDGREASLGAAGARWNLDVVVIDAGHGGKDPGAVAGDLYEKDVTLGVALKLGAYLEEHLDVEVVYTRDDDRFIALKERGHIANQAGGKLFISIHANASENPAARGAETFFLGMHKTEAAREVMERENSVIRFEEDPGQYEAFTNRELALQTLTHSAYMRKSEQLSDLIQQQFEQRVRRKNRGVKQAGFYVLWSASMPAVLVELGFLTNPREAAFLTSESGQAYMASALFRAVREYKTLYEKGLAAR